MYRTIVNAMVAEGRKQLAQARLDDHDRPIGTHAIDIDFYSKRDREATIEDSRWCVRAYRWDGSAWRKRRRLSGPLIFEDALDRAADEASARGVERRDC